MCTGRKPEIAPGVPEKTSNRNVIIHARLARPSFTRTRILPQLQAKATRYELAASPKLSENAPRVAFQDLPESARSWRMRPGLQ